MQGTHTKNRSISISVPIIVVSILLIALIFSGCGTQTSDSQSAPSAPTSPSPSPSPQPVWNVIINSSRNAPMYQNYIADSNTHFLIVDASFENQSSDSQVLNGDLFDLQDSTGQHYQESQASNPGQSFSVDPGQSIETETVFEVPDSQCSFELSFIPGGSTTTQWSITGC